MMLRFLRPDLLDAAGIADFDALAATFGADASRRSRSHPTGGVPDQTRFAKFLNVPELLRMWHIAGDVKTAEDLNLDVPQMLPRGPTGRAPETVVVAPTAEQVDYVAALGRARRRCAQPRGQPGEDNMLAHHQRRPRRRAGPAPGRAPGTDPGEGKLAVVAAQVAGIWRGPPRRRLSRPSGRPHPVPGAFRSSSPTSAPPTPPAGTSTTNCATSSSPRACPASRSGSSTRRATTGRRRNCSPPAATAGSPCSSGSTEKMGVGTNVQDRAVALHHLDCPWRPADLQQREGRIVRQGNQNAEVAVFRYVTEGSFDAYMWQTVTRKAAFIAQVMRGNLDIREIEDIGDAALLRQRGQGARRRQPAAARPGPGRGRTHPAGTAQACARPDPLPPPRHHPSPRAGNRGVHRRERRPAARDRAAHRDPR